MKTLGTFPGMFIFFLLMPSVVFAWDITIEPNGVISLGTTLKISINAPDKGAAVDMEIVEDKDSDGKAQPGERRLLKKTSVKDGKKTGKLRDMSDKDRLIVVEYRIKTDVKPAKYIVRFFPKSESLPKGVVMEITDRDKGLFSRFKNVIMNFPKIISDPVPAQEGVRGREKERQTHLPDNKKFDLWLMNAHTYQIEASPLTDTGDCLNPHWSPDGKGIIYVRQVHNKGQLWLLKIRGADSACKPERLLKSFSEDIRNPLWANNGDKIAFLADGDLWITHTGRSDKKKIVSGRNIQRILAWSKNDSSIFFSEKPAPDHPVLTKEGEIIPIESTKSDDKEIPDIWRADAETGELESILNSIYLKNKVKLYQGWNRGKKEKYVKAEELYSQGEEFRIGYNYEDAKSQYEKELSLYREIGYQEGEANCLKNLGHVHKKLYEHETARHSYERALVIFREIKARRTV